MTIPSPVNRAGPYIGDDVATAFDFKFKVYDDSDLDVIVTDNLTGIDTTLTLGADYTVTGVGNDGGGQVILTAPLSAGFLLVILPDVPFTQEIDLENQGAYLAETVERGFDLAVMRDQQLSERLSRAVTIPPSADASELDALIADILRLGGSVDEINTVSAVRDQVVAVAGVVSQVVTVAAVAAAVAIVAGNNASLTTVASDIAAVNAVVANKPNIDIVAGASPSVTAVAGAIGAVQLVSADLANIDAVVSNKANIDAVAGVNAAVAALGPIAANVTAVAGMAVNIAAVVADKTNIDAVGGSIGNVNTVAALSASVSAVALIASQVQTVAANAASTKNFGDVYLGPKAADPTTRNDGTSLQAGDLYFNTAVGVLKSYNGSGWYATTFDSSNYYTKAEAMALSRVPIGTIIDVYGNGATTPAGYLKVVPGMAIDNTYPELRAWALANGWGVDGNGNPVFPSSAGYDALFKRGWSAGQTQDAGRAFGTIQPDGIRAHTHPITDPGHAHTGFAWLSTTGSFDQANGTYKASTGSTSTAKTGITVNAATDAAADTRPANITVTWFIKAYDAVTDTATLNSAQVTQDLAAAKANIATLQAGAAAAVIRSAAIPVSGVAQDILLPTVSGKELEEFTLELASLTPSASLAPLLQFVTGAGAVVTGYLGTTVAVTTQGYPTAYTTGIGAMNAASASVVTLWKVVFRRSAPGSLFWTWYAQMDFPGGVAFSGGSITLPAEPTAVRVTSQAGTVAYTSGNAYLERKYL